MLYNLHVVKAILLLVKSIPKNLNFPGTLIRSIWSGKSLWTHIHEAGDAHVLLTAIGVCVFCCRHCTLMGILSSCSRHQGLTPASNKALTF